MRYSNYIEYIDGLLQDSNNSIASAMELLQSSTKPSIEAIRKSLDCVFGV